MHQEILDYIEAHRQYGYDLLAELGQNIVSVRRPLETSETGVSTTCAG